MYTKNLEQLLRLLHSSRQSGVLTVEPVEPENAFWQGQFQLIEGNVVACLVWRKADRQMLLNDEDAVRWLSTQGRLNWSLQEGGQLSETLLPPLPPRRSAASSGTNTTGVSEGSSNPHTQQARWIPRRTEKGMRLSAQSLVTLEHRQVFTLVNGNNSAEGITRLLRKSPDSIFRVLNDLRDASLIE